ncbi:sensor histidine kinase [Lacibacter sp. MH-610]|uniref:sensor histidine kinase n=1 Tax=Lacibacter sp. MH-610 TaxID=3020883 RepID=UPI0038920CC2
MLKRFYHLITGDYSQYTFEHRVFNLTSCIIFLFCAQATTFNFFLDLHITTIWLGFGGMITSLLVFYVSRIKQQFSPSLIFLYSVAAILLLGPLHFYNGGSNGPVAYLIIMLLFIYIFIAPLFMQGWIYAMYCAALLAIFLLEYLNPQWVIPYETKEQRFIDYGIVLLYITFFTSFTIWIFRKSYDREQKTIRLQKEELERLYVQTNEKNLYIEALIKELHHRVKNNLQVVSSLMSLQSNRVKDAEARMALEEGRTRVNAMALIHQKLYLNHELAAVNMGEYLEHLCASLAESFGFPPSVVFTEVQLTNQTLDIDRAVSIGLVVNELVTNSFKHAFQGINEPRVTVYLKQTTSELLLEVADNGKGIQKQAHSKNSFGMKLIETLVQQLGASIQVEHKQGTKSTISITSGI